MIEIIPGVFSFPLYTRSECKTLLKQIDQQPATEAPNSMNKYGTVLGGAFKMAMADLVKKSVLPIAIDRYGLVHGLHKHPHAFVVDYSIDTQRSLAKHYDQSDVTLNVCLGREFDGGGLVFYGDREGVKHEMEHEVGRAIVHRGSHEHRARPLTSGKRTNLILWCLAKKPRT